MASLYADEEREWEEEEEEAERDSRWTLSGC